MLVQGKGFMEETILTRVSMFWKYITSLLHSCLETPAPWCGYWLEAWRLGPRICWWSLTRNDSHCWSWCKGKERAKPPWLLTIYLSRHLLLWRQPHVTDSESHIQNVLLQIQTQFSKVKLCRWGEVQTAERAQWMTFSVSDGIWCMLNASLQFLKCLLISEPRTQRAPRKNLSLQGKKQIVNRLFTKTQRLLIPRWGRDGNSLVTETLHPIGHKAWH